MATNHLVALSPAALAQLGGNVDTPVRVRRVNPPEDQRAMLRSGNAAPLRMDTPGSLLTALRRRLPESGSASLAADAAAPRIASGTTPVIEAQNPLEAGLPGEEILATGGPPVVDAAARPQPGKSGFVVQAAAFSSADNARRAADELGGEVSRSGPYHLVRTGPFATRGEAEASLANVRRAGYSDARILTSG